MSNFLEELLGVNPEEDRIKKQAGWSGKLESALIGELNRAWQDMTEPVVDPEKVIRVGQGLVRIARRALSVSTQRGTEMVVRGRQGPSEGDYFDAEYKVVEEGE